MAVLSIHVSSAVRASCPVAFYFAAFFDGWFVVDSSNSAVQFTTSFVDGRICDQAFEQG